MAPSDAEDFENHQWKSEFASSRSGRNSPNIFAKFRRKLLLSPPVRCARSPTLTEEELDALTGDLPYETNYTYAYSKIYDPSLPDHWEVPNLTGGPSPRYLAEQEHWSAASLGRQLFYLLRFPVVLLIHVITYILEALYHVVKISTFTVWDFLLYLIKSVKIRYESWMDHRNRTALIRNRQDPFKVKAAQFLRSIFGLVTYIILAPIHFLWGKKSGVEQYEYKSIKNQLKNERASRMMTRSQTLERSRKFEGLSQSPSRRAPVKQSTLTTITAKVFASGGSATPTTSTVKTTRTVRERSVTPRFQKIRSTKANSQKAFENEHEETEEVDTPLSTYGLRSRRGMSHVNTPEPTFDIGQAAATSTPLFRNNLTAASGESTFFSKTSAAGTVLASAAYNVLRWMVYLTVIPFLGARMVFYYITDNAISAYMKWTNAEPTAMEPINVRASNEPVVASDAIVATSWTQRLLELFYTTFNSAKNLIYGFLALSVGAAQESAYFIHNLGKSSVNAIGKTFEGRKRSAFSCLGLLLFLLLAFFLLGTPTNITDQKQDSIKPQGETIGHALFGFVKKYASIVWEQFIDVVFEVYTFFTAAGRTTKDVFGVLLTSTKETLVYIWKTILWIVLGAYDSTKNVVYWTKDVVVDSGNNAVTWLSGLFASTPETGAFDEQTEQRMREVYEDVKTPEVAAGPSFITKISTSIGAFATGCSDYAYATVHYIVTVLRAIPDAIASYFVKTADFLNNFFYEYIWKPISSLKMCCLNNAIRPLIDAAKYLWSLVRLGAEIIVHFIAKFASTALWILTWPFGMMTRAWIHISNYAPEEVIQVIPIPQAVTPDPILETLQKQVEVEDEELTIHPAPAPAPIPIPHEPPVIIHQTNVVETVDKEAIIKEVTEKLRSELSAELSARFQQELRQELSAKFEANYNTLIEKLKVENANIQIDNHHLETLIRQMIYEYDTDKTGKVDYALESSGGAVVSTRCSETYKSYTRLEKFWDIPIYYHHYSPRVVIQRNSKSLFPGECWCFKEGRGYIAVELSHFIDVSSISYEHIGKEVAPEGNRSSAPKGVLVWAYKQIDDLNSRVLIGDYTYSLDGPPLQFFIAKHKPDFPVKFVELEVTSNYGAQFTCLYRLRVHGMMIKM